MPFPEKQRIIFKKNPLDQVICQLRFPPILKIDTEIPADFQEEVREHFPNFSESTELNIEISPETKAPIPPEVLQQLIKTPGNKNYEFKSEDGLWKINLTRTFIALSAGKYERWEKFKNKLSIPLKAFFDIYNPSYFSRIGLRYIDIIRRSTLNLDDISWRDLLNPFILGLLGSEKIGDSVINFDNKYELNLSDKESIVRIMTKFVQAADNGEICYMIDSDFFNTNKTPIDKALTKLDFFNTRGSRLIQWCITEKLYKAMEPEKI